MGLTTRFLPLELTLSGSGLLEGRREGLHPGFGSLLLWHGNFHHQQPDSDGKLWKSSLPNPLCLMELMGGPQLSNKPARLAEIKKTTIPSISLGFTCPAGGGERMPPKTLHPMASV